MIVKLLGEKNTAAYMEAEQLVKSLGMAVWDESYFYIDVSIAPFLIKKMSMEELKEAQMGTLIFHPSPLPYGRGASAIKWAYKRKEPITAATWFWADENLDTGDICEQEIIKIDYQISPKEFYEKDIIPAMRRTLERCLRNLQKGIIRRIPQVDKYATFDKKKVSVDMNLFLDS